MRLGSHGRRARARRTQARRARRASMASLAFPEYKSIEGERGRRARAPSTPEKCAPHEASGPKPVYDEARSPRQEPARQNDSARRSRSTTARGSTTRRSPTRPSPRTCPPDQQATRPRGRAHLRNTPRTCFSAQSRQKAGLGVKEPQRIVFVSRDSRNHSDSRNPTVDAPTFTGRGCRCQHAERENLKM